MRLENLRPHLLRKFRSLRPGCAIFLSLIFTFQALAADLDWHTVTGSYATFQAPAGLMRSADSSKAGGGLEIFESPDFGLTFEGDSGALPRELQTDFEKAVHSWSAERRKNWKVNTYLEDDQHLAYAAIRTGADAVWPDSRPLHLSFGFAAGEKPFSIHIRFHRPEDLAAIERLLQSLKLKTL